MPPSDVSIVVVSYHTREKLRRCLLALEPAHEVIVVDNASTDGSPEMVEADFPQVKLIRSDVNLGFSAANNRGAAVATRPLLLFLNSDAYAEPGAVETLAAAFADPSVSVAGGRLLNPDGSLQDSTARELTLAVVFAEQVGWMKVINRIRPGTCYWTTRRLVDQGAIVDTPQVMGACLMVRRAQDPVPWDERYFLYCEDTDLCRRYRAFGRVVYVPAAVFVHELGSSSGREPWRGIARYNAGKVRYFQIHHGPLAARLCHGFNRLGALLRLTGAVLTARKAAVATWRQVLHAPFPCE